MEGVVLKRTLTRKSTLWFGKYEGLKVQQVIDLEDISGITYLVWIYFNIEKVDYCEELIEFLSLSKFIIDKPDKNKYNMGKWKAETLTDEDRLKLWHAKNRTAKFNKRNGNRLDNRNMKRSKLANKNGAKN